MSSVRIVGDAASCGLATKVNDALNAAVAKTDLNPDIGIYSIDGMSGKKYRYFINQLVGSLDDPRYLEVGSWMGSTLCSAIHGNKVRATAIDNWSEFGGPKDAFMTNVRNFITPEANVTFIESDFRAIDYTRLPHTFNIYLFDGPHEAADQYDGLALALSCLDDYFIFIVDDWNWEKVRDGTLAAITKCELGVLYAAAIRTTDHGGSPAHILPVKDWRTVRDFDWHNGYFIAVLAKPSFYK
jgi:hypothetical protein